MFGDTNLYKKIVFSLKWEEMIDEIGMVIPGGGGNEGSFFCSFYYFPLFFSGCNSWGQPEICWTEESRYRRRYGMIENIIHLFQYMYIDKFPCSPVYSAWLMCCYFEVSCTHKCIDLKTTFRLSFASRIPNVTEFTLLCYDVDFMYSVLQI